MLTILSYNKAILKEDGSMEKSEVSSELCCWPSPNNNYHLYRFFFILSRSICSGPPFFCTLKPACSLVPLPQSGYCASDSGSLVLPFALCCWISHLPSFDLIFPVYLYSYDHLWNIIDRPLKFILFHLRFSINPDSLFIYTLISRNGMLEWNKINMEIIRRIWNGKQKNFSSRRQGSG